jgi:hypothetical protein
VHQPSGRRLSASVLSDTQIEANVSPQAGGLPLTVRIPNAAGIVTPSAFMVFGSAFSYAPATVPHAGAKNVYLHDPVRKAVFALSRTGNALVRYQFDTGSNGWVVTSMPSNLPTNMAFAPDGSRLWLVNGNSLVSEVDPVKTGGLPITTDASLCTPGSNDCFYGNQFLLPSVDSKTLFWIGNQNMQVFSIP